MSHIEGYLLVRNLYLQSVSQIISKILASSTLVRTFGLEIQGI